MENEEVFVEPILKYFRVKKYLREFNASGARLDIVFAIEFRGEIQEIIGIEIKSDKDTYKRLRTQLPGYYSLCDRVYLAISNEKELPENLPWFVGVLRVSKDKVQVPIPAPPLSKSARDIRLFKARWNENRFVYLRCSCGFKSQDTNITECPKCGEKRHLLRWISNDVKKEGDKKDGK